MKIVHFHRILIVLIVAFISLSCSSDLDFNQANDLKLEAVFISNLAYFDIPANRFVTNGVEQSVVFDSPTVDVFNDAFFTNHLTRADLSFEINNTIDRAYTLDIVLRDKNNQPLYTIKLVIPASAKANPKPEIFENANLDLLKSTTRMTFIIRMLPGTSLNENSLGSIKLRSGVTAYLIVQ